MRTARRQGMEYFRIFKENPKPSPTRLRRATAPNGRVNRLFGTQKIPMLSHRDFAYLWYSNCIS